MKLKINKLTTLDEFADVKNIKDDDDSDSKDDIISKITENIFPLYMAIIKGNPYIVQLLLLNDKIDINKKNNKISSSYI